MTDIIYLVCEDFSLSPGFTADTLSQTEHRYCREQLDQNRLQSEHTWTVTARLRRWHKHCCVICILNIFISVFVLLMLNKCPHTTFGFFFSIWAVCCPWKRWVQIIKSFFYSADIYLCQVISLSMSNVKVTFSNTSFFSSTAAVILLCAAVGARQEACVWNYPVMICSTDGSIKQKQQTAALNLWCVLQLTGPPGGQHIQTRAVVRLHHTAH